MIIFGKRVQIPALKAALVGVLTCYFCLGVCTLDGLCKTATVTYDYAGALTDTVAILVSETPDFTATLSAGDTITGAVDTDRDGSVDVNNLIPGATYYFSAVAWTASGMSGFAVPIPFDIPVAVGLNVIDLPPIPIESGNILNIQISVQ